MIKIQTLETEIRDDHSSRGNSRFIESPIKPLKKAMKIVDPSSTI